MKVLFVYRSYGLNQDNPVVQNQIIGLKDIGVEIVEYKIISGGLMSYLKSIFEIRKLVKDNKIELIHAHYSFSGIIAVLTFSRPVICSLMGSDVLQAPYFMEKITKLFVNYFWSATIVKSSEMATYFKNALVVPNGIDLDIFKEIDQRIAQNEIGYNNGKINLIFIATDINTPVKNFALAKEAVSLLPSKFILHGISNVPKDKLAIYYNAADLLLLTSDSEGSPNVIKEALACCCPIISTDVGDVKYLIEGVEKCVITSRDPVEIARNIENITGIIGRTNGNIKLKELSIGIISNKIKNIYLSIIK